MDEKLKICVKSLEENEDDVRDEARRVLLNICRNVLRFNDEKSREVRLDDEEFIEKLLPAIGAMECLFEVGYIEDGERIYLPHDISLSKVQYLSKLLSTMSKDSPKVTKNVIKNPIKQKIFFEKIVQHFHDTMRYENSDLQRKAKSVIPIAQLELAAMSKMRELQKSFKLHNTTEASTSQLETELIAKDLFLVELLHWFKYKFFKWVDKPTCSICSTECVFEKTLPSVDPHCSRVEIYKCKNCDAIVEFPRYTHPEPLLTLRRGRCGEWANVFTLLCRSLDYDARFIMDETDHVWTEIWSASSNRWIHVDSCEFTIDKPLMYEKGWNKKLTYVIAFSKDEIQDVTWRYTRDQEAVMRRRQICTEESLITFLRSMSCQRQISTGYSRARREYVIKRNLMELANMIYVPNSQDQDSDETYEGRNSGSLAWRLARGEVTQSDVKKNYVWNVSKYGQTFELRYNIVKDIYQVVHNDGTNIVEEKFGWLEGTNDIEGGIFRKVENDWKMVYLARSPQVKRGIVKWTFEIANSELCLETFSLKAKSEVFHGANVSWEIEAISNDNETFVIPINDCNSFDTKELQQAVRLNVVVTLTGGQDQIAWQHAQLFRQSLENIEEPSMIIIMRLRNRSI